MKKNIKTIKGNIMRTLFLTTLFLFSISFSALANVSAQLSSDTANIGEVVYLTIKSTSSSTQYNLNNDIDLSSLKNNFEIVSTNKGIQSIISNNKTLVTNELKIGLSPKKEGKLEIPPLNIGSSKTQALYLDVSAPSSNYAIEKNEQKLNVFLKGAVDNETPFEQEQIIYTLRAYVPSFANVLSGEFKELTSSNAIIKQIKNVEKYETKINENHYTVYEAKYFIFPTTSGKITIDSQGVSFIIAENANLAPSSIQNLFSHNMSAFLNKKEIFLKQDPVNIDAKPKPQNYKNKIWLPAQSLQAEFNFPSTSTTFKTGEPIDISIYLKAKGLVDEQLPDLEIPPIDGLKVYPGNTEKNNFFKNNANSFKKTTFAIIPTKPGETTIPSFSIPWYNTLTGKNENLNIPEIKINSIGTATTDTTTSEQNKPIEDSKKAETPTVIQKNSNHLIIIGASIGLGIGLFFLIAIYIFAKKEKSPQDEQSSNKKIQTLKKACELSNPKLIQDNLLDWANSYFKSKISNISKIGEILNNSDLKNKLEELNQNIYSNNTSNFNGTDLYKTLLSALNENGTRKNKDTNKIPKLYPF